jgi:signal transduction histidine kinase
MPSSHPPRDHLGVPHPADPAGSGNDGLGLESGWRTVMDRELSAALGSFAAGVAHEARNQIFAVTATLDAFEARFPDAAQRPPHFGVMREDLQRLTTLMHSLAEFGHPSAPVLAFGHVRSAASDALAAVQPSAEKKNLALHCRLDDDRATAFFDRERLGVGLRSLLEHAIRRSPVGSSIELTAARGAGEEGLITVAIQDQGPALPPAHLERIFEPFFSPNRAVRGLDLALAKRIVEQHGGSVLASNRGKTGICLALLIPGSGST